VQPSVPASAPEGRGAHIQAASPAVERAHRDARLQGELGRQSTAPFPALQALAPLSRTTASSTRQGPTACPNFAVVRAQQHQAPGPGWALPGAPAAPRVRPRGRPLSPPSAPSGRVGSPCGPCGTRTAGGAPRFPPSPTFLCSGSDRPLQSTRYVAGAISEGGGSSACLVRIAGNRKLVADELTWVHRDVWPSDAALANAAPLWRRGLMPPTRPRGPCETAGTPSCGSVPLPRCAVRPASPLVGVPARRRPSRREQRGESSGSTRRIGRESLGNRPDPA
jgi:hypothetical protein